MLFRRCSYVPNYSCMDSDRDDAGFTLIELLVVIMIIGILAAIAIPAFLSQKSKGYEASMKSDLRTVASEVESQNVDKADYTAVFWKTASTVAASGIAISGSGQVVGNSTSVSLSAGNSITWVGSTAGSFCLRASSAKAPTKFFWFSNIAGGLSTTACTS
jgi:type IV pilus assembly protein PilA